MNTPLSQDATPSRKFSEADIQIDSTSQKFLEMVIDGTFTRGKVVMAKVDDQILLGVGSTSSYHAVIISDTARLILQREVATSRHPDHARPHPGIIIEGAYFHYEKATGKVSIYDKSGSFGAFRSSVFSEPTEVVVARFLKGKLEKESQPAADLSQSLGDFPQSLRQFSQEEGSEASPF